MKNISKNEIEIVFGGSMMMSYFILGHICRCLPEVFFCHAQLASLEKNLPILWNVNYVFFKLFKIYSLWLATGQTANGREVCTPWTSPGFIPRAQSKNWLTKQENNMITKLELEEVEYVSGGVGGSNWYLYKFCEKLCKSFKGKQGWHHCMALCLGTQAAIRFGKWFVSKWK